MAKERLLTVMVPIKDSDCEATVYASLAALQSAVSASAANTDKIYKIQDGTYYRSTKSGNSYSYVAVTDREFPTIGEEPLHIYNFTYDATRMGPAPTITANGVMRFADEDIDGDSITLDGFWSNDCFVMFNGEKFRIKRKPSMTKDNEDARYKYDIEFVSDRIVLENTYMYDVVAPFASDRPISENSSFSFFGDINMLADRINANLIRNGLATLVRKHVNYPGQSSTPLEVPYLTYRQWNLVVEDPYKLLDEGVFEDGEHYALFYIVIYLGEQANYNDYLRDYIYVNVDGVYASNGYKVVVGKDKTGAVSTSEEKIVSFDNNTLYEALQQFHDTFGLDYYITQERDGNGNPTGNTLIMVADCEHDFADWDSAEDDYVRGSDNIPISTSPFDYGAQNELLLKGKDSRNEKIVTRITGVGSAENIPWYYPNPTQDGWIKPVLKTSGTEQQNVSIDYPSSSGSTPAEMSRYEKYLKNYIGEVFKYGKMASVKYGTDYEKYTRVNNTFTVFYPLMKSTDTITNPVATMYLNIPSESNLNRFTANLIKGDNIIDTYISWGGAYENPTAFQTMCANRNGGDELPLDVGYAYQIKFTIELSSVPLTTRYDRSGYLYPMNIVHPENHSEIDGYVAENFYTKNVLVPYAIWDSTHLDDSGYSTNGEQSGKVAPMSRSYGKVYKDVSTGLLYRCVNKNSPNIQSGANCENIYEENPTMLPDEWLSKFMNLKLKVYEESGWHIRNDDVTLSDYGLGNPMESGAAYTPSIFDTIEFKRLKYITPRKNLMPEVYVKTDGERRFYDARNYYPLRTGTADTDIGEVQDGSYVINPIYKEHENDPDSEHYDFENEYSASMRIEHIEDFEDVKPTIKEQTNIVDGVEFRIDIVQTFGYDALDNNEIWMDGNNGTQEGSYKHPYFFAKLRPLGFNIFDVALQDDMVVSMATGACGACNFRIGVDEKTKKNPVQLWNYDVYGGPTFADKGTKLYNAGDLRRYVDITNLYYDTNGQSDGYKHVSEVLGSVGGGIVVNGTEYADRMFDNYVYSSRDVENGYVGVTKQNGKYHFEGDVVTQGRFIESQQDTTENYVWVALMKDVDTYGTIMPSAEVNYSIPSLNTYIRPKSADDVDETSQQADNFVFINIRLPQIYLRRAERMLSHKLVKYMYEHNKQKYSFKVNFSRIYLEENEETNENLNENSVVYVLFDKTVYRQYVKHYTYKMDSASPLPEINVETNEDLPLSVSFLSRTKSSEAQNKRWVTAQINNITQNISSGTSAPSATIEWQEF